MLSVSRVQLNPDLTLQIFGSDTAEQVTVSQVDSNFIGIHYDRNGVQVTDLFNRALVQTVIFQGYGGDDEFTNTSEVNSLAFGGAGNDRLEGGSGNDDLRGGDGNDVLIGGRGNDLLYGEGGNDYLDGSAGNDSLRGGDGDDVALGGLGNDTIMGDAGNDDLQGNAGDDVIRGGVGNDTIRGGNNNDLLYGDDGNDYVAGGDGDDTAYGGLGDDDLVGGTGNDTLRGEDGSDLLIGNTGNDTLIGGLGNDRLWGNEDNDILRGQGDDDLLNGGAGDDDLFGEDGVDSLYGEDGNDELFGGLGNDYLSGGEGNDDLQGNEGNDGLYGDAGNDVMRGLQGSDRLFGGLGDDQLFGGDDADLLVGDEGSDNLMGDLGNDVLIGGLGADLLNGQTGDDLLIGGSVTHNHEILGTLLATWNNGLSYESRVALIENEIFSAYLQSQHTVLDDYVSDSIVGGDNRDWFFLTGIMPIYDPLGEPEHGHDHEHADDHGGHSHPATIVYDLPQVEGFDLIDSLDKLEDKQADELMQTLIPHADDSVKRREHLALFELVRYDQVTHTAIASGEWSSASTWANGVVPTAGARVLIPIGVEVQVDRNLAARHFSIRVDGSLTFAADRNTLLRVDTMVVSTVGRLEMGTADRPINANVVAKLEFSGIGPINRAYDPFGISRGLITHGSVSMHGAEVTAYAELAGSVTAGTSVLHLAQVPVGWKVGDQIVIAGTQAGQIQDEVRQIAAIVGSAILIQPLTYNHITPSTDARVHVANLTRNVVLESELADTGRRGHVMFMHNRDVNIHNTAFNKLGRSSKFQPVNDSVVNQNWDLVGGTGSNPRGRYSVHFHRNDTTVDGHPSVVQGSVVSDSVGWGFVNHSSYVDISDNVTFNVKGAGFATEVGDETGSFSRNLALSTFSSGEAQNSREPLQDFGHTGDGFWFQGAGISVTDNISAGSEGSAFLFYTRGLRENGGNKAHYQSANLPDPSIAQGAATLLVDHVPIGAFHGNVGYASGVGLTVRYHLRDALHNTPSVFHDSTFWNNSTGVSLPYSHNIVLRDLTIVHGSSSSLGVVGVESNGVTKSIIYDNLTVSGYYRGINVARRGTSIVNRGSISAQLAIVIRPPLEENRQVRVQGAISFSELPPGIAPPGITEIDMRFDSVPVEGVTNYVFYHNSVILNYGLHTNRKAYYAEQVATAVPFPQAQEAVPSEYVGRTTQYISTNFGLTIGGELAPANVVTAARIHGLLDP